MYNFHKCVAYLDWVFVSGVCTVLENIHFDSIDLLYVSLGSRRHWFIWVLAPILQSVCKFHHDLYEVHTFWTAMIPQCATVIESWCGSSSAWPSGLETRTRPRTKSPAMDLAASLAKMMAMIFVLRIVSAQSTLPRGLAIGEATASVNS